MLINQNLSVAQLKYIISKSRFGVFSRTHASIAAYSSAVPSVVIGYSVKARGIGKDLELDQYVVGVESLESDKDVLNLFLGLLENETDISNSLVEKNVKMLESVEVGKTALSVLIKEQNE